mmetsp:Transcript_26349/g.36967  ORF Transcript_26349/g.36967 Transcript_26349/m.36967 type:complete len:180 (-) Transcript_26349:578-1117(-)
MLPALAILILPPTFGGSAYFCWYQGQQLVLRQRILKDPIEQQSSFTSYAAGIGSLGVMYGLQRKLIFPYFDGVHEQQLTQHLGSSQESSPSTTTPPKKYKHKTTKVSTTIGHKQHNNKTTAKSFVPPQNLGDVYRRIGPPVLVRLGAASIAFFMAGIIQTYVESSPPPPLLKQCPNEKQ